MPEPAFGDRAMTVAPGSVPWSRGSTASVLAEQRTALQTLVALTARRLPISHPPERALSATERARLIAVALEVLHHAAVATEAECRHIVSAAEVKAADIIAAAHRDIDRLAQWLDADVTTDDGERSPAALQVSSFVTVRRPDEVTLAAPSDHPVASVTASAPSSSGPWSEPVLPSSTCADADTDIEDEFFATVLNAGGNRWGSLEDDPPATGSTRLRRVLRRAAGARAEHLVDEDTEVPSRQRNGFAHERR